MGRAYKNIWSLNIDEAVAVGILREKLSKHLSVFMPTSAQMPDVDLAVINLCSKRVATIQVKGSRAHEPRPIDSRRFKQGSPGWFFFNVSKVTKCTADYFLFLVYVLREVPNSGRRNIEPHVILIKTSDLIRRCKSRKVRVKGNSWNFFIWVDPVQKKAFDYQDSYERPIYFNDCLDGKGIAKLNEALK